MKRHVLITLLGLLALAAGAQPIDRRQVVERNNPHVIHMDTLSSLTVGNGHFAMTVDATGLQTFPEHYRNGVPLGTMSDWGWHSFPNPQGFKPEDALEAKDFGRGHQELYSAQFKKAGRQHDASEWLRKNPHRLHLGCVGFDIPQSEVGEVTDIDQTLDLWNGSIVSRFRYRGRTCRVETVCRPDADEVAARVKGSRGLPVVLRFPYPTGGHSDDGCNWQAPSLHQSRVVSKSRKGAVLSHTLDSTTYYIQVAWQGKASIRQRAPHEFVLVPASPDFAFTCRFSEQADPPAENGSFEQARKAASTMWNGYWTRGGIVDFGHCSDARARELERRVVLSRYLMRTQEAGDTPPQETGLTYNSWFGKFHLEMEWWHQAHYALWGHPEILDHTLEWYFKALPKAREIARRQGFRGARWMKMTDPSSEEAPSNVGSYLIWQQPHIIYLTELLRRAGQQNVDEKYGQLIDETADFMLSFAVPDTANIGCDGLTSERHAGIRYILKGCIPAQETLKASEVVNPPFELNYWYWGLKWAGREQLNDKLPPLTFQQDSLYLAAETATDTYRDIRFTSDHPALLGAMGILPESPLVNKRVMAKTLDWIWENWNWDKTWGWDYPMVAMTAARLGQRERAVDALLMKKRTNTYLPNGHNYQDKRLRVYMPGNGGLLVAVAMMCAGWDGCKERNPGFPQDWDVRWEGLLPLP